MSHTISGEHLSSILVLDLNDSRRLDPGLTVHLNGNPLITQDSNFHCSTLWGTETKEPILGVDILWCSCLHFSHGFWCGLTCAMRWCCSLMTLDTAICMLPNTATTSRILSSNDGAQKICRTYIYKWHAGTECVHLRRVCLNSHWNLTESGCYIFCLSANLMKTFQNVFIHLSICLLFGSLHEMKSQNMLSMWIFDQRNILGATTIY